VAPTDCNDLTLGLSLGPVARVGLGQGLNKSRGRLGVRLVYEQSYSNKPSVDYYLELSVSAQIHRGISPAYIEL